MDSGQRKLGRVAYLALVIGGMMPAGNGGYALGAMKEKNDLLTNGYRSPVPGKHLNQRQKRKRARQMNRF